jgi:hypothetical protein
MRPPLLTALWSLTLIWAALVCGCGSVVAGAVDAGSETAPATAGDGGGDAAAGAAGGPAGADGGGGSAGRDGGGSAVDGEATSDAADAAPSDAKGADAPRDVPASTDASDGGDARPACPAGFDDCNHDPKDGCEQALDDDLHCGGCAVRCQSPTPFCATSGGPHCASPATTLSGQRLEMPCTGDAAGGPQLCASQPAATDCPAVGRIVTRTVTFGGRPGVAYDVTARVRGVVEPKAYSGGRGPGDHFYVGGQPTPTRFNVYRLAVSSPNQVYYLNFDEGAGETYTVMPLDHTKVLRINGGATLTLDVVDIDCAMVRNCQSPAATTCTPYVVPGIPPAPSGYNGQFVQIDVTAVVNAP